MHGLCSGDARAGVWAHEHREPAVEEETKWRNRITESNPMDICLDTNESKPSGVAGFWWCDEASD